MKNFAMLCAADPRLIKLIEDARAARADVQAAPQGNIWVAYSDLKSQMSQLVGWRSGLGGWMQTDEGYDIALRALSDALGI